MTLKTERQQFAEQNEMSMDFVNWCFDEKKDGCGNAWFIMAAAMWEGWKGRANREAQPVAGELGEISVGRLPTMNQEEYPGLGDWWVQLRIGADNDEILARVYGATPDEAMARARALTATPAPAPAVLPEASPDDIPQEHNINTYSGITWAAAWNACRSAMLAQPVSSGYTFPGRWIDCTDALPQNGENIITLNNIGGVYGGYIFKRYENGRWAFVDAEEEFRVDDSITHWMPLPAAPDGGNGSSST